MKHFQSIPADKEGTLRLVNAINDAAGSGANKLVVEDRFQRYWPKFSDILSSQRVVSNLDSAMEIESESPAVQRVEAQLAEAMDMIRQLADTVNPRSVDASSGATIDGRDETSILEGAWAFSDDGAKMFIRNISGNLHAPYAYGTGSDELTGVYYGWKQVGNYWFVRFRWIEETDIHGYGFYRLLSENVLDGAWWFDDDAEPDLQAFEKEGVDARPGGTKARLERIKNYKMPDWAELYFSSVDVN